MNAVVQTAEFELLSLSRDAGPRLLTVLFLGMMAISSIIGLLTNLTVSDVWRTISSQGLTSAPNPFQDVSVLYYAHNSVIYIILVGSLAAIIAGVTSGLRDRQARAVDMVLTRQVSTNQFMAGKFLGLTLWLVATLVTALVLFLAVLALIGRQPLSLAEAESLAAMFFLALPLLSAFAGIGLLSGVISKRESTALVSPIAIWAVIAFVVPLLGTAARPVGLLNPVSAIATTGGPFDLLNTVFSPFAFAEQFKAIAAALLDGAAGTGPAISAVIALLGFVGIVFVSLMLIRRNQIRGVVSE